MKWILVVISAMLGVISLFGQAVENTSNRFSMGVAYAHEFVLDGDVRVREWDVQEDKIKLKDVGMNSYSALQFHARRQLPKNRSVSLTYDQYFVRGSATFDHDITYNGTV